MALALMLGMLGSLLTSSPVMAANASGSVSPTAAANDGTSVLSFAWNIWSWVGTAAYYTFAVYIAGDPDPLYIQYSDGAGVDSFPGVTVPLQDVAGTVGAPDVHLRNPGHPDPHKWTVPAGFAPGPYTAWSLLYLEGQTSPIAGAFISFIITGGNARISIEESATNRVGDSHDFTITVEKDAGNEEGWVPAAGVTVTPGHSGAGSITSTAPYTTDAFGQVTVTVNSGTPGVATVHASATVTVGPVDIAVATDGAGAHIVDNQKTWVSDGPPTDSEPRLDKQARSSGHLDCPRSRHCSRHCYLGQALQGELLDACETAAPRQVGAATLYLRVNPHKSVTEQVLFTQMKRLLG